MTSAEFVIWLKGFIASLNSDDGIAPGYWHRIKTELENVNDSQSELEEDAPYMPPNEDLLLAAKKYKEWLEKTDRPVWYSTSTNNIK